MVIFTRKLFQYHSLNSFFSQKQRPLNKRSFILLSDTIVILQEIESYCSSSQKEGYSQVKVLIIESLYKSEFKRAYSQIRSLVSPEKFSHL